MSKATMMRTSLTATVAIWLCACGGGQFLATRGISLQPLYGTELAGVRLDQSESIATISFAQIPTEGVFLRLTPACAVLTEAWTNDEALIHLVVAHLNGIDIGVVPVHGAKRLSTRVELGLSGTPSRKALKAPIGPTNAVDDLQVSSEGSGQVRLSWTERNTGDYDFNGEVNIADLTPLGLHFGSAVGNGPGARLTQEYWVDGDHNGEINLSDLTPIGANFLSTIAGYQVYRNGALVSASEGAPSVPRPVGNFTASPPVYEFVTAGQTVDEWEVRPVDAGGSEGEPSKLPGQYGLVLSDALQTPPSLFELMSLSGIAGNSVMRVILPGDDPYRLMPSNPGLVPPVPLPGGGAGFKGLEDHAGELLYADILFAPQADLATGDARSGPPFATPGPLGVPDNYLALAAVPFVLSSGVPAGISADVSFTPHPSSGYFVNLAATTATGGAPVSRSLRLDYPAARLACDTDNDGDYGDEAWLDDSDRDCVSERRYQQEEYNAGHAALPKQNELFTDTIQSFSEADGLLTLSGGIVLQFSELCSFKRRLLSLAAPEPEDLLPADLVPGDTVSVQAYTYETAEPKQHWATYVERQDDPGMALSILPQTLADGGSATYLLRYIDHGSLLEAQVLAHAAQDINSLYCELDYDPARFKLVETPLPGALQDLANDGHPFLEIDTLYNIESATPGLRRVQYAASLADPQSAPKLGSFGPVDAVLVSIYFYQDQAEAAAILPQVPTDDSSRPVPQAWSPSDPRRIAWTYGTVGDFNQDGAVNPLDLRPIALEFEDNGQPAPPFPDGTLAHFLDTNADGSITGADAAVLWQAVYRERRVDSFQVFVTADGSHAGPPDAVVPFLSANGNPAEDRIWFETLLAQDPPDGWFAVIAPAFGTATGAFSVPFALDYSP